MNSLPQGCTANRVQILTQGRLTPKPGFLTIWDKAHTGSFFQTGKLRLREDHPLTQGHTVIGDRIPGSNQVL